jgi:preprotein translocase subunit SecE
MVDNIKIGIAVLAVIAGVYGFYHFDGSPTVVRVVSVLAGLLVAAVVMWLTEPGQRFVGFSRESVDETRKVVWPTRKETLQMTGIVFAFCVVAALFLWIVDIVLLWAVQLLMGRSE